MDIEWGTALGPSGPVLPPALTDETCARSAWPTPSRHRSWPGLRELKRRYDPAGDTDLAPGGRRRSQTHD